jgi:hypothetical protein
MRPDPHQRRPDADPGSIIYLGDVRKRRGSPKRAPDRQYVAVLGFVAMVGWASWLLVATNLAPARLLTYIAFFTPLAIALFSTTTLTSYVLAWRAGRSPSLRACARRGVLSSVLVIANLALLAGHRWNVLAGVVTLAVVVVADVMLARRPGAPA